MSLAVKRPRGEAGFTLFEVLIAFVILSVTLIPVFVALDGGLSTLRATTEREHMAILAETVMAKLGTEIPLVEGEIGGKADGVHWQAEIQLRKDLSRPNLAAMEVILTLGLYQQRSFTVQTLKLVEKH